MNGPPARLCSKNFLGCGKRISKVRKDHGFLKSNFTYNNFSWFQTLLMLFIGFLTTKLWGIKVMLSLWFGCSMYELLKHLMMLKPANQTFKFETRDDNGNDHFPRTMAKVTQRGPSASSLDTIDTNKWRLYSGYVTMVLLAGSTHLNNMLFKNKYVGSDKVRNNLRVRWLNKSTPCYRNVDVFGI